MRWLCHGVRNDPSGSKKSRICIRNIRISRISKERTPELNRRQMRFRIVQLVYNINVAKHPLLLSFP